MVNRDLRPLSVSNNNACTSAEFRFEFLTVSPYVGNNSLTNASGYRIQLRVRLGSALASDNSSIEFTCDGRLIELASQKRDVPLKKTKWVIFSARDFKNEEVAREFGEQLRAQVELAALSCGLGVDTGQDQLCGWWNEDLFRSLGLLSKSQRILQNVHGLLIVPDDDNSVGPFFLEVSGKALYGPEPLLGAIAELSDVGLADLGDCIFGVRLLNSAYINSEPLARAVLAFSAVEALGQDETWSRRQKVRLEQLAVEIENEAEGKDHELLEISVALRRGLHRIGLRQGVMRVLERLDLGNLKKEWDSLYAIRSGIFHGTNSLSKNEQSEFANQALRLCTKILMEDVRAKGHHIPKEFVKLFGSI